MFTLSMTELGISRAIRGRGSGVNPPNRFGPLRFEWDPDWPPDERPRPETRFYPDHATSLITSNDSPDLGFRWTINAYRGCEHGCAYCYARPYHEYLGFSSGLEFETKIMVKLDAPEILRRELAAKRWKREVISMSGVTDCYQPAERRFRVTRGCLEVLAEARQPVGIVTKNHLVTRDIDLLAGLAEYGATVVYVSVTTLDADLAGKLEPRASRPEHRLAAIRELADAGIPVGVMIAPVIPGLTDHEIPGILEACAAAGAGSAAYSILRLPHAVKDVFLAWLDTHVPTKMNRVLGALRDVREGALTSARFGERMRGSGVRAEQIRQMFRINARRWRLDRSFPDLSGKAFRRPALGGQMEML